MTAASAARTAPHSDLELETRVSEFLESRGLKTLTVCVDQGIVTLMGRISSGFERQLVVLSVRRIPGVVRISDQIRVFDPEAVAPTFFSRIREFGSDLAQAASDWFASTPKPAWVVIVVGLLAPLTLASCGSSDVTLPVHPVKGKVLVDGQPAAGATVTLNPESGSQLKNAAPTGTVKEDGTFDINLYGEGDGAPTGDYVVTVQWFKLVKDPGGSAARGPNVLPATYATPDKSPLKVTVKEGPNDLQPIEIKSK